MRWSLVEVVVRSHIVPVFVVLVAAGCSESEPGKAGCDSCPACPECGDPGSCPPPDVPGPGDAATDVPVSVDSGVPAPTYWSAEATRTTDDLVFARVDGKPFFALGIHPSVKGGWDGSAETCYKDPATGKWVGLTNDGYETTLAALEAGANFAFLWGYGQGPEWGALYHRFYGRWQWHWGTTKPKEQDVIPIIVNEYGESDLDAENPEEKAAQMAKDFEDFKARRGRWSPENAPNLPPYEELPWFAWHPTWRMIGTSDEPGGGGSMLSHEQATAFARATNMMIGDNYTYVCNRWDSITNLLTGQKGEIGECYDDWLAWADPEHDSYFRAAWDLANSLREKANPDTLIWMWIQGYSFGEAYMKDLCTKGYSDTWAVGEFPTPRYLRKEIMSSVAAGATGIIFFGYGDNRRPNVEKMLTILRALSSEDVYEPVLTSPRLDLGVDTRYLGVGGRVHAIVKWHAATRTAYVAGANPGPYRTPFILEFPWTVARVERLHWTVPGFLNDPEVQVMDRSIAWDAPEDEGFILRITPLFAPDDPGPEPVPDVAEPRPDAALAADADDSSGTGLPSDVPGPPDAVVADPGPGDFGFPEPGPLDAGPEGPKSCGDPIPGLYPVPSGPGWPSPNAYSWDGSWSPAASDFPIAGLYDNEYFDGHLVQGQPSPILPPGNWDWNDGDNDLAWWKGFASSIGALEPLRDHCDRPFGWRLVPHDPTGVDYETLAAQFEGSSGTDILNLGPLGKAHSTAGQLGDGPDLFVFQSAWSLDFRAGSTLTGALRDDDLVVAGCSPAGGKDYLIQGATVHTGPGADRVFARDIRGAAVDLGNGDGGLTDALDPSDGDDVVVLRGNVKDTRVFGGDGDDLVFWFIDEMQDTYPGQAQGGNLFGGGGAGDALWGDPGTDRLVLVVPTDTVVVERPATPPGALLVMTAGDDFQWDLPTVDDPYARYCYPCGVGPGGRRTLIIDYVSTDGHDKTAGYVFVTAFEEVQVGIGPGARVYRLDEVAGKAVWDPGLAPLEPPDFPSGLCVVR